MIAYNKVMYHFHVHNEYDPLWEEDNEIIVDKKFNIPKQIFLKSFSTGVYCVNPEGLRPIEEVIDLLIEHINTEEKAMELKRMDTYTYLHNMRNMVNLLRDSSQIIRYASIYNLETALEETRRQHYDALPSRMNSMFVMDEDSLDFWWETYKKLDADLYELSLTGNIFKTSAAFMPPLGATHLDMQKMAHSYWNPKIATESEIKNTEYLFNGKAKVLRKINKEI